MKALVKIRPEAGLSLCEQDIPEIGSEDVLIKIEKTAICGTDIHIYQWDDWAAKTLPVPLIVGHEYAGEIVKTGANVTRVKPGQKVSGEGHIVSKTSRAARAGRFHLDPDTKGVGVHIPGAFAEYLKLPAFNIVVLPEQISTEIGAILDPMGNAVHAALAFDLVAEDVLITGAGPIGIMAAGIAEYVGARNVVITDIQPYRLELAEKIVPNARCVNILKEDLHSVMTELRIKEGFDVGIEMSGVSSAFKQMMDVMIMGGKIAYLGLPSKPFEFDFSNLIFKAITIKGIYGRQMYETWYKMLAMLESGLDLSKIITHRFKMDEYEKAFKIMASGKSGKIIMDWASC